jgi:hypothetical protein
MNTTLKQAENLIDQLKLFTGNSLYAKNKEHYYIVYSYTDTYPIAAYDYAKNLWYVNEEKYSVTTTKHQSIVRQALKGKTIIRCCNTGELLELLKETR